MISQLEINKFLKYFGKTMLLTCDLMRESFLRVSVIKG